MGQMNKQHKTKTKTKTHLKWHYFSSDDPRCHFSTMNETINATLCGREATKALHTEFKLRVSCLKCLNILNKGN